MRILRGERGERSGRARHVLRHLRELLSIQRDVTDGDIYVQENNPCFQSDAEIVGDPYEYHRRDPVDVEQVVLPPGRRYQIRRANDDLTPGNHASVPGPIGAAYFTLTFEIDARGIPANEPPALRIYVQTLPSTGSSASGIEGPAD